MLARRQHAGYFSISGQVHARTMRVPRLRMPAPCPRPTMRASAHLAPSRAISRHLGPGAPAAPGDRLAGAAGAASHQQRAQRGRDAQPDDGQPDGARQPDRQRHPRGARLLGEFVGYSREVLDLTTSRLTSHEGRPVWRCFSPLIEFLVDCSFLWSTHGMAMGLQCGRDRRPDHVRATRVPREPRDTSGRAGRGRGDLRSLFRGAHVRSTVPCAGHALHDGSAHTHVKGLYTRLKPFVTRDMCRTSKVRLSRLRTIHVEHDARIITLVPHGMQSRTSEIFSTFQDTARARRAPARVPRATLLQGTALSLPRDGCVCEPL